MGDKGVQEKYGPYTLREWWIASLIFISLIIVHTLRAKILPGSYLHPSFAIAIVGIFFGGLRLAPVVLIATIVATLFAGNSQHTALYLTLSIFFSGVLGGYLLKWWNVDPIQRRDRDTLRLIATVAIVSLIPATLETYGHMMPEITFLPEAFLFHYMASLFSLIILTPFLMRWCAKPWFRRTWPELFEIISGFALLFLVCTMLFTAHVNSLFGIPFFYYLVIPFFFISMRLRPRFVTLALLITALFAVSSFRAHDGSVARDIQIFLAELYLTVFACNFLIMTALEEHRRANAARLSSQVATLENAVAKVSTESRAKNDFIAILAHELRNPLTPVVSGIEILKLKKVDPDDLEVLQSMEYSMQTVKSLLNDLLDVSRISEGKIALKKKVIDLEPTLNNAVMSTEHHRKERHQRLIFKNLGQRLFIFADPVRIEQIFSNLLTNASKYSNEGDTITLTARKDGHFAEIVVTDEGVGLEKHVLERIFDPFQQVEHGERSKEGLGIGLSLVRDFVRMHEGTVAAISEGPGKGSRFIVRLPLSREKALS